jgi:hypothetical protein
VDTDVKTNIKGEASGTDQDTVGMDVAATQFWSSACGKEKADELKFK